MLEEPEDHLEEEEEEEEDEEDEEEEREGAREGVRDERRGCERSSKQSGVFFTFLLASLHSPTSLFFSLVLSPPLVSSNLTSILSSAELRSSSGDHASPAPCRTTVKWPPDMHPFLGM